MVTADIPTSVRVKTIQDSHRRRFARSRPDNPFQGFRIKPEANVRMQNDEPELYQSLGSFSSPPPIRLSIDPSPTNILLEDHFSKGTAKGIAQESDDNLKTTPFLEVTGSGSYVASQDIAAGIVGPQPAAFEIAARNIGVGIVGPQPAAFEIAARNIGVGIVGPQPAAFEIAARNIGVGIVGPQPAAFGIAARNIGVGIVGPQPAAFGIAARNIGVGIVGPQPAAFGIAARNIGVGIVGPQPAAFEIAALGAMESGRESRSSPLQTAARNIALPSIVQEFANGVGGVTPEPEVVKRATYLVEKATSLLADPEFTVDSDGALAFDLQLSNGYLMLAELYPDGRLGFGVYDESRSSNKTVVFLGDATNEEMTNWFCEEAC